MASGDCSICIQAISYPVFVCPGAGSQELDTWKRNGLRTRLPECTHQFHVACMDTWKLTLQRSHRRVVCPVCRLELGNNAITLHYNFYTIGFQNSAHSEGPSEGESASSESSSFSESESSDWSGSSSESFGPAPYSPTALEQVWLRLHATEEVTNWYACCATGRRCWVPALRMLAELGMDVNMEHWLVTTLQRMSYLYDRNFRPTYRNFMRPHPLAPDANFDRPVFELFWDNDQGHNYVSCLSIHSPNCSCGAEERGSDLRYVQWDTTITARICNIFHNRDMMQGFSSGDRYEFHDERARPGEEPYPWLRASPMLSFLKEDRVVAADMTVHELIWQCRRCRSRLYQTAEFVVVAFTTDAGWNEYWIRPTTIGWQRRNSQWES